MADDLYDLCELYDLYNLAHVVGWEHGLHRGKASWVGPVPYRSCTAPHNGRLDGISVDDLSLDDPSVDDPSVNHPAVGDLSVDDLSDSWYILSHLSPTPADLIMFCVALCFSSP